MTSPEEMSDITRRMREFCDANQITCIVSVNHGPIGSSIHICMEDFARVFAGSPVDVTTGGGFDHLRGSGDGFDVLALRPMPMALGPRVEVMP